MDILLDFDGTCVTHEFPAIGKDIGAVPVLKALVAKGHKLILFTMRSDLVGDAVKSPEFSGIVGSNYLEQAVNWFNKNLIPLHGIQTNPGQEKWTNSPKAYGQLIIDDIALGIPLKYIPNFTHKPFVDWDSVESMLISRSIL